MRRLLAGLLVFAYVFALVMSTGHLSEWYALTLGSLPGWFAVGLAAALELSAFLLSLLSNSLLRGSRWANFGALTALGLVWVGNFFSMSRANAGVPSYEVLLASLFVPVSTYVVAKVLGELLSLPEEAKRGTVTASPEIHRVDEKEVLSSSGGDLVPSPSGEREETSFSTEVKRERIQLDRVVERFEVRRNTREVYLQLLEQPRTARELVDLLGVTKAAVYKQLRALEEEGLVKREDGKWEVVRRV